MPIYENAFMIGCLSISQRISYFYVSVFLKEDRFACQTLVKYVIGLKMGQHLYTTFKHLPQLLLSKWLVL